MEVARQQRLASHAAASSSAAQLNVTHRHVRLQSNSSLQLQGPRLCALAAPGQLFVPASGSRHRGSSLHPFVRTAAAAPSSTPAKEAEGLDAAADHDAAALADPSGLGIDLSRFSTTAPPVMSAAAEDRHQAMATAMVQWYPGHIARAERQLKGQLQLVDVVLEVRDARILVSTHHPQVATWCGQKPRVLVINRMDEISDADRLAWTGHFQRTGQTVFWTDGKAGTGVKRLKAYLAAEVGVALNEKRVKRGLKPRAVRACVIGFPNIGKSALINRLLARRVVESAPKPGVTRQLRWVRLDEHLELLDAPGVIPMSFKDQIAAQRLAMCNDIGEASYLDAPVAAAMLARIRALPCAAPLLDKMTTRYGLDARAGTAEDFVYALGQRLFFGQIDKAGQRILNDYRTGLLGSFALELPEELDAQRARVAEAAAAARAKALAEEEGEGGPNGGANGPGSGGTDGWGGN